MGENLSVAPEVITLEQLNSGQYQGKRVQVQKIHFTETDNSAVWLGTHAITDNERTGYVLTLEGAAFKNQTLPAGQLSVTGVVGAHNSIQPQVYVEDIYKSF